MPYDLTVFQAPTAERMITRKRHGVAYPMGLGKTVVGVFSLWHVRPRRVLILCPRNALRVWEDHIVDWFRGLDAKEGRTTPTVIWRWRKRYNNQDARRKMWGKFLPDHVNVYITTVAGFLSDVEFLEQFDVVIIDEAKRIRNYRSEGFKALKPLCKACQYFWPMTGTPGRLPGHFFTMLHLMDPKYFSSYWNLVRAFMYTQKAQFGGGLEILGWKNKAQWDLILKQYFTFVSREQAGQLPIRRQVLYVQMDEVQQKHYDELSTDMLTETPDGRYIIASTSLTATLRLRQLLVCPKILGLDSYGVAIEDLIDTLQDSDPHIVIFTPFTEAFPFFTERLNRAGIKTVETLSGGLTPDEVVERIERYRRHRGIMLCSISYATAFSLEPADRAFFIGYDFDPDNNAQAEYRIKRLTTTHSCVAYYYCHEGTYDETQLEILDIKVKQEKSTVDIESVGLKF
jgi:SNF2 family DNA or RNA helicase